MGHDCLQLFDVRDGRLVDFHDDVAALQTGLAGRGLAFHERGNLHAAGDAKLFQQGLIGILHGDAKIAATNLAVLDELIHDLLGHVARDGEADPRVEGGVDAAVGRIDFDGRQVRGDIAARAVAVDRVAP